MTPTVTVTQQGRSGHVTYREGPREITGYQEFGGGDVVAIVWMGSADDWRTHHGWALPRRSEILRFVAEDLIRQKAPTCWADVDEASGDILLRSPAADAATGSVRTRGASSTATAPPRDASGAAWVRRYSDLKGRLGMVGLIVVLLVGAALWVKTRVLVVQPVKGVPFGSTVRIDSHFVTLIDQRQPYTPSLHHDPSTERFTLSVFLVPHDGTPPALVPLVRDLRPGGYSLARVIGSDGRTLWIDASGLAGVNLRTHAVVSEADVAKANPMLDPRWFDTRGMDVVDGRLQMLSDDNQAAMALDPVTLAAATVAPRAVNRPLSNPPLTQYMAAGLLAPDGAWFGLQSAADLDGEYRPGRWLRAVESATDTPRETRRLVRGALGSESGDGGHRQIRSMTPLDDAQYRNASFLRLTERSEPLRLASPDSLLMLHTSGDGTGTSSTLLLSRVEIASGRLLWTADTGVHRFALEQVLPTAKSTAFVGTRPPIPDKVSEPLIVIVDHSTGRLTTHSLWQ